MTTNYDNLNAGLAKVKLMSTWPSTPSIFYNEKVGGEASQPEWKGGELMRYSPTGKLFIQTATSGTSPTWRTIGAGFATTTSTSTSTSSSTTTSSSTSSSSSTSTSTSTSSSTSTSTSTSSTTTS